MVLISHNDHIYLFTYFVPLTHKIDNTSSNATFCRVYSCTPSCWITTRFFFTTLAYLSFIKEQLLDNTEITCVFLGRCHTH